MAPAVSRCEPISPITAFEERILLKPARATSYSDSLRALGKYLEPFAASELEIFPRGDRMEACWRVGHDQAEKVCHHFGAAALQAFARALRGTGDDSPRLTTAELLRTIGRLLDDVNADEVAIVETRDGFCVTARFHGFQSSRTYARAELVAQSRQQRLDRVPERSLA